MSSFEQRGPGLPKAGFPSPGRQQADFDSSFVSGYGISGNDFSSAPHIQGPAELLSSSFASLGLQGLTEGRRLQGQQGSQTWERETSPRASFAVTDQAARPASLYPGTGSSQPAREDNDVMPSKGGTAPDRGGSGGEDHPDADDGEGEGLHEGDDDGDEENPEKTARMRDKNRRAQQRFRQRQKAKLQSKEQEAYFLQRQLQDLQAQLSQRLAAPAEMELALVRLAHENKGLLEKNQALQNENLDLRRRLDQALASQVLSQIGGAASPHRGTQSSLQTGRTASAKSSASGLSPHQPAACLTGMASAAASLRGPSLRGVGLQLPHLNVLRGPRLRTRPLFGNVSGISWQAASPRLEVGMPVGLSPGNTGATVLFKVLHQQPNGSVTTLCHFPPGFVHESDFTADSFYEEGFILQGSLTDVAFNETFYAGDYAAVLPGQVHGPYRADPINGCMLIVMTRNAAPAHHTVT